MMECPQCAEPIKRKALVCRFCGFKLESFVDRSKSFSSDDPGRTEAAE
jgi:predicted amidophosphoribosyltransferase